MKRITKSDLQAQNDALSGRVAAQAELVEQLARRVGELTAMPQDAAQRAEAAIRQAQLERDGAVRGAVAGKLAFDELFEEHQKLKSELAALQRASGMGCDA